MVKLRAQKRSVVLIPYTYQGHMTPMLQLGKILHSKGFAVIVAHPRQFNSIDPLNHPDFIFLPLDVDLSAFDLTAFEDVLAVISTINRDCVAPLVDHLARMMKDSEKYGRLSCIIYDVILKYGGSAADRLKIPSMVLNTCSAAYFQTYDTLLRLHEENQIPLPESKMLDRVPGLHALRYKDLSIPANTKIQDEVLDFFAANSDIGSSVGVIWNTTEVLDHIALSQLKQRYKVPFFPIGPFHRMSAPSSTSFLKEDRTCMAWLDKQAPNSVVYVSLGSLAVIDQKELEETAWGLANCGLPFLWVIRPSLVVGSEWIELLPEGFQEIVGERGQIVKWAPQKEVLAHSSVGGFLSHCGWNSTLESISEGVPIICRPCFADQWPNTRYITHVWKVGVELEEVADRVVLERTIRRVMVDDEGKEIRQIMGELKQRLEHSMQKNGSSYKSLNDLTEFIYSSP